MLCISHTEKLKSQGTEATTDLYDNNKQSYVTSLVIDIFAVTFKIKDKTVQAGWSSTI
jgi:hypothetical protein